MQFLSFSHKEDSYSYSADSQSINIVLTAKGSGASLACRTIAEMILTEGSRLMNYSEEKLAYLLLEQLHLAAEIENTKISCSFAFAAADTEHGKAWLFSIGEMTAYSIGANGILAEISPDSSGKSVLSDMPDAWKSARCDIVPLLTAEQILLVCTESSAAKLIKIKNFSQFLQSNAWTILEQEESDCSFAAMLNKPITEEDEQ